MTDDLSDYERLRLQNIKKNIDFLELLGMSTSSVSVRKTPNMSMSTAKGHKIKRGTENDFEEIPTRRSKRLRGEDPTIDVEIHETVTNERDDLINYTEMPMESSDLDDFEFQVFVSARAWRLILSRENNIEPYKVFHNRTIAEVIRRRRNDEAWATSPDSIRDDLLQCWGVGPSKARDGGYTFQLLDVINEPRNQVLFRQSQSKATIYG